jgi:hypothetical protein
MMKGTLATMTRRRRRLGEYPLPLAHIQADKQDDLDRCWSGKGLSTPRTESTSSYPSLIPNSFSSLYMLLTWLY